jgi:hypothetical protein
MTVSTPQRGLCFRAHRRPCRQLWIMCDNASTLTATRLGPSSGCWQGSFWYRRKRAGLCSKFTQSEQLHRGLVHPRVAGPTGETNRLGANRARRSCVLDPDHDAQIAAVKTAGGQTNRRTVDDVARRHRRCGLSGAVQETARAIHVSGRTGPPICTADRRAARPCDTLAEQHVCIDTTASGGNTRPCWRRWAPSAVVKRWVMFPIRDRLYRAHALCDDHADRPERGDLPGTGWPLFQRVSGRSRAFYDAGYAPDRGSRRGWTHLHTAHLRFFTTFYGGVMHLAGNMLFFVDLR